MDLYEYKGKEKELNVKILKGYFFFNICVFDLIYFVFYMFVG